MCIRQQGQRKLAVKKKIFKISKVGLKKVEITLTLYYSMKKRKKKFKVVCRWNINLWKNFTEREKKNNRECKLKI
jgi:hypothetical protein